MGEGHTSVTDFTENTHRCITRRSRSQKSQAKPSKCLKFQLHALGHTDFVKVALRGKKVVDSGSTVLTYAIIL